MIDTQEQDKWLNLTEASALTSLHKNTVRGYVKVGRVESKRVRGKYGNEILISAKSLVKAGLVRVDIPSDTLLGFSRAGNTDNNSNLLEVGIPDVRGNIEAKIISDEYISSEIYKEMLMRYEHALVRLGQLENQRILLSEKAESLQKLEEENKKLVQDISIKENIIKEINIANLEYEEKLREKEINIAVSEEEKKRLKDESRKTKETFELIKKEQDELKLKLEEESKLKEKILRELIFKSIPWWKKIFSSKDKIEKEINKKMNEGG